MPVKVQTLSHGHPQSDITNLLGDLAGKAGLASAGTFTATQTFQAASGLSADIGSGDVVGVYATVGAQVARVRHGSAATPVNTLGPTIKVNRTEAVLRSQLPAGADGVEHLAALSGVSVGTAATEVQAVGVFGAAKTSGTSAGAAASGNDACGVYGVGRALAASSSSVGIGGFFAGRRDTDTSRTTGIEVYSGNFTPTDGLLAPNGDSSTKAIWLTAGGDADSGVGIQLGNPWGRQFKVGLHFNGQVIGGKTGPVADQSIRDDSHSTTSIAVRGSHTFALTTLAAAGDVVIGNDSKQQSASRLEVYKNGGGDPLMVVSGQTATDMTTLQVRNGGASAKLGVTGGTGQIVLGTAAADLVLGFSASKVLHFGRYSATPDLRLGGGVGFHGATPAARPTGWASPTGTATRTAFDTTTVTTAQLAERVKALIDDLTTYGLIGA